MTTVTQELEIVLMANGGQYPYNPGQVIAEYDHNEECLVMARKDANKWPVPASIQVWRGNKYLGGYDGLIYKTHSSLGEWSYVPHEFEPWRHQEPVTRIR